MSPLSVTASENEVPLSPVVLPTKLFLTPQRMGSCLSQKHEIKSFNSLMLAHSAVVKKKEKRKEKQYVREAYHTELY